MTGSNAISPPVLLSLLATLALVLVGCGSGEFDDGKARGAIEAAPVKLDAEQVTLSLEEVNCGIKNDLWEMPTETGLGRSLARLTAKARALKFDDDVVTRDPDYSVPHVQVRGDFPVAVFSIAGSKDGPEKDTKLVEAKVGARIDNSCFPNPLPIMGLKKGNFSPDVPPVVLVRNDNGWRFEKFVH